MHAPKELQRAKVAIGIGICAYEAAALAVNDVDTLPPITAFCHRYPLAAVFCVSWVAIHLLRPWIPDVRARVPGNP